MDRREYEAFKQAVAAEVKERNLPAVEMAAWPSEDAPREIRMLVTRNGTRYGAALVTVHVDRQGIAPAVRLIVNELQDTMTK